MIVEIIIKDDSGNKIYSYYQGDAFQPADFKTNPDKPLVDADNAKRVEWKYFGYVYQPMVRRESKFGGF